MMLVAEQEAVLPDLSAKSFGRPLRILIAADLLGATNGVGTLTKNTKEAAERLGHTVTRVTGEGMRTVKNPFYPELPLLVPKGKEVAAVMDAVNPDYVIAATPGLLSWRTVRACMRRGIQYATASLTNWPYYLPKYCLPDHGILGFISRQLNRVGLQHFASQRLEKAGFWVMRRAHRGEFHTVLVPTEHWAQTFKAGTGLNSRVEIWHHGTDTKLFRPLPEVKAARSKHELQIIFHGRLAPEKEIEWLTGIDEKKIGRPCRLTIIGGGPYLSVLQNTFRGRTNVVFTGELRGEALVQALNRGHIWACGSVSETFGCAQYEASAVGLPLLLRESPASRALVSDRRLGVINEDPNEGILQILECADETFCEYVGRQHPTWDQATKRTLAALFPAHVDRIRKGIKPLSTDSEITGYAAEISTTCLPVRVPSQL